MKAFVLYDFQGTILGKIAEGITLNNCEFNSCYLKQTSNISDLRLMKSDAVLFNINRVKNHLPISHNRTQVFVLVSMEPPNPVTSSTKSQKGFKGEFTWSMTYRLNSDIPLPYGTILLPRSIIRVINGVKHITKHLTKNKARKTAIRHNRNYYQIYKQKHLTLAWYQRSCTTESKSEEYVKLLQKHIQVDIYGNCSMSNQKDSITMTNVAKVYKFLLIFEDRMCVDYISEEVFDLFHKDIVLVLRGAGNYDKHLPLGTFISTDNHRSPDILAHYLSRLSSDEKSYTAILQRKDTFTVLKTERAVESAFCELCRRLNNLDEHKRSTNEWWKHENQCVFPHDLKPFRPG